MMTIPAKVQGKWIRLPGLSDEEYDFLSKKSSHPLDICPTCRGQRFDQKEAGKIDSGHPDQYGFVNGQYRYQGEIHECDCDGQKALYRNYLAAGIGEQYMRLDWDYDYKRDPEITYVLKEFIDSWEYVRANGTGLMIYSEAVGTGKTLAATYIAKSLVKKGVRVYMVAFSNMVRDIVDSDPQSAIEYEGKLQSVPLLIMDEVWHPESLTSEAKSHLFSNIFERIIRNRTDANLPTIFTTNSTPDVFEKDFPRIYSLVSGKIIEIEMKGLDFRKTEMVTDKLNSFINKEIRPIV